MDYIVLDMEWNQPWPGSPSAKKVLPVAIRGEIIQIGAVRVTQDQQVADEFQILIKPKYYRHLNRRVSKLTGIKEARLREEGVPFPEAMETFVRWCGEDVTFLTWGFDDIGILRENLELFGIDTDFTQRWYNAQMIFNAQTDGSSNQRALRTAMELLGKSITAADGTETAGLGLADFTAVRQDRRIVGDVFGPTALFDEVIVGFMNKCTLIHGVETPLLTACTMGFGNDAQGGAEGYHKDNVFASELTGPLLVKNPRLLETVVQAIYARRGQTLPAEKPSFPYAQAGYAITAEQLRLRLEKENASKK